MKSEDKPYVWVVVVLGLGLIVLSLSSIKPDPPDAWLIEWTEWTAKYVAIIVAINKVWKISDALIDRLRA